MQNFHALSPQNLWLPQYIHAFTNQEALVSFSIQSFYWNFITRAWVIEFNHTANDSSPASLPSPEFGLLPRHSNTQPSISTLGLDDQLPSRVISAHQHPTWLSTRFDSYLNWVYYQYWWNKLSTVVFPYLRFHFTVLVTCDQPQSENRKFQKWLTIHAFSIECHSK